MATPYTHGTRTVNENHESIPVSRLDRINLESLDGPPPPHDFVTAGADESIPGLGVRTPRQWSVLFGCDADTIRRWVKSNDIPHKKPGGEMLIAARDLWDHLPYVGSGPRKPDRG